MATKSHNQFEPALKEMKLSLEMFGHDQPALFYTDNPGADKAFLERAFPSLLFDVVPVDRYQDLPPLTLDGFEVKVASNTTEINRLCLGILADPSPEVVVGFDMKWPVYLNNGVDMRGGVIAGKTALVQIAHEHTVYLFQVSLFCRDLS